MDTNLRLRACPPSRSDDDDDDDDADDDADDDGFPCWEWMCFLCHVCCWVYASADAIINGDSRKLGR